MRRGMIVSAILLLLLPVFALSARAQADKLVGRWEGKIQSFQGERETTATFKKEGEAIVGTMSGLRPGSEMQLKEIKIEGNKITATADVESPQGSITINYTLMLDGDSLKGQGALDFNGQNITFEIALKRATGAAAPQGQAGQQGQGQRPRNPNVPQPQQKQTIDYFIGQWSYSYLGRESALGPAPRDCTMTFTKRADGKSADGIIQCKHEGGTYTDKMTLAFDEATKMLSVTEKLASGATLNSRGDWKSPIAIRFTIDPVKIKGQSLQLRRTISIVAAHSFTIAEELSEDGGPFVRLGNAVVAKVEGK